MKRIKTWKLFENKNHLVEVIPNRYVYHTSNPIFRDKISKDGLIPKGKSESWLSDTKIDGKVIFVVNDNRENYRFDSTYDDDIYRIDTIGLNNKWYNDPNFDDGLHLITFESIPLSAIELVYKGSFSLDESFNSIDHIEGELEDIVVHYCEGTNADFKLDSILCDGGVFIWKVDDSSSMEIRGKENWWNFVKIHNNMARELGYEFYPIGDYLLFTKFGNLEGTIIEILDWISTNLELKVHVTDFNNGYVVGKRLRTSYSYGGKILIEWTKYTNSEGVESLSPMRGSFIRPLKLDSVGAMNKVGVYVDKIIYSISSGIVDGKWERIIRSWLEERDPLFKEFNISIDRVN